MGNGVIVIAGPTASGKTRLSVKLASRIGGEIISADSMQVYKHMDIGTAKPSFQERSGISHHMIDEAEPGEEFSVVRFQQLAYKYIDEILEKGSIPIIAGGTGLYINSLIYNITFSESAGDPVYREEMKRLCDAEGAKHLHNMLKEVDPAAAAKIHENDAKRIIRALEVFKSTNMPISHHQSVSRNVPPKHPFLVFGLTMDREMLYDRIDSRVDIMMKEGLLDEVRKLQEMGCRPEMQSMQGLGYKELLSYMRGESTLDEAVSLLKKNTRNYAKRQLTWFRRIEGIHWLDVGKASCDEEIIEIMEYYIAKSGYFQ